jgi:hypothetical protein
MSDKEKTLEVSANELATLLTVIVLEASDINGKEAMELFPKGIKHYLKECETYVNNPEDFHNKMILLTTTIEILSILKRTEEEKIDG